MNLPPRAALLGALLVLACVVIGALVTYVGEPGFDEVLVREAASGRDGWFGAVMDWLSDVGYARWLVPAALVASLWFGVREGRWRAALIVALATPIAAVVTRVLKETFERTRPADGVDLLISGFSMPSGHATSSAAFAVSLLVVLVDRRARRIAWVVLPAFAVLVAVSRVVVGAHYPSDVVAGLGSGTGVALLVAVLVGREVRRGDIDVRS